MPRVPLCRPARPGHAARIMTRSEFGERYRMRGPAVDQRIIRAQPHRPLGAFDGFLVRSAVSKRETEDRVSQCEIWVRFQCPAIRPLGLTVAALAVEDQSMR